MKNTLRKRFVFFAMLTVTVLLAVLVGAISGCSWLLFDRQSGRVLEGLASSGGIPAFWHEPYGRFFAPPMDMDTFQSARFFIVWVDGQDEIVKIDIQRISAVSSEDARQCAQRALASGSARGRVGHYKFTVRAVGQGGRGVFFLDTSAQSNAVLMVTAVSILLAAVSWLLMLAFVVAVSGRVVRPVLEGLEKQKQFITNAGHELKTPLAIIQSNNDAMAMIQGENKYNVNIRAQVQRLGSLMSNLLTLAKLDEGVSLPTAPVELSALLAAQAQAFAQPASQKRVALQLPAGPALWVQGNATALEQVVSTLLDNAVKYTPEGGVIRVQLQQEGRTVALAQQNTCPQPPAENPERLFDRFYRGDAARTHQAGSTGGYGIGLSAARALCESMGGSLAAAYPAEGQICFAARLPAARPPAAGQ